MNTIAVRIAIVVLAAAGTLSAADYGVYKKRYTKLGYEDPSGMVSKVLARSEKEWADDLQSGEKAFRTGGWKARGYVQIQDAKQQKRVDAILARIRPHTHRPSIEWKAILFRHRFLKDHFNAFSQRGRYIYVSKYLLKVYNDEELAFTLCHEISHVMLRHGTRRLGCVLRNRTLQGAKKIDRTEANWIQKMFWRITETEADAMAVVYFRRAGYKGNGYKSAIAKMGPEEAKMRARSTAALWKAQARVRALEQGFARLNQEYKKTGSDALFGKMVQTNANLARARLALANIRHKLYGSDKTLFRTHPECDVRTRTCEAMDSILKGEISDKKSPVVNYILPSAKRAAA